MRVAYLLIAATITGLPVYAQAPPNDAPRTVLFCFWNVENLFDDRDDDRKMVDEEFDNGFAHNARLRELKYDRISSALVKLNDGKGPDVLACAEVESIRAADLLKAALNAKLKDPALHYKNVLMKNLDAGRHIATCVITRVDVSNFQTRLHGGNLRILETHLYANGHELCVMATHWTSHTVSGDEGRPGREKYARTITGVFDQFAKKNPAVDFLVCGDFNDTPDAEPVVHTLRATSDRLRVVPRAEDPYLLDLFAGKDPNQFGTHYYQRPVIYDHVCVSPGLLDTDGWSCDPASAKTVTDGLIRRGSTRRQPWRFGSPKDNVRDADRGYSDHFPVVVTLTVQPKKPAPPPKPKKGE
jgi:endonuclease/exonuclease/phosphatase family metal-dependent hydrolase